MDDFTHNSNGFYTERVIEETIRHGPAYYRSNVGRSETTHDLPEPLTPRETEVLSLVARGLTNNQVATGSPSAPTPCMPTSIRYTAS
jgi:hypothetical protein